MRNRERAGDTHSMRTTTRTAIAVSMCLLGASVARAGQGDTYVAVDLTPTSFLQSLAVGASNGAQVGFGIGASTFGADHALLWAGTAASTVDLHPPGYHMSNALATSGIRQVGWATHPATATPHAFLWSGSAASGVDLNPTEMVFSRANGVFGDVQVGSGAGAATGFIEHALLWRGNAASVLDLNPPGFFTSDATAVSEDQQVGVGNNGRALLWTGTAESAVDLTPFWCLDAEALGVSGGQQVGRCRAVPDFSQHALMWTGSATTAIDLHPSGYLASEAHGVASGRQVGFGVPPGGPAHALVWSGAADSVIDLNQFLPSGFADAVALGIDDRGQIVGWARETSGGQFLHAFVWKPVPRETAVAIDIKPGSGTNSINPQSNGRIAVAILSSADFDAGVQTDSSSLTFGRTGNEASLTSCSPIPVDVNFDGRNDLVCHFATRLTGFVRGVTRGMLRGMTIDGATIAGADSIQLVPRN
jgi:probable HAF family extracellular repeat protein